MHHSFSMTLRICLGISWLMSWLMSCPLSCPQFPCPTVYWFQSNRFKRGNEARGSPHRNFSRRLDLGGIGADFCNQTLNEKLFSRSPKHTLFWISQITTCQSNILESVLQKRLFAEETKLWHRTIYIHYRRTVLSSTETCSLNIWTSIHRVYRRHSKQSFEWIQQTHFRMANLTF